MKERTDGGQNDDVLEIPEGANHIVRRLSNSIDALNYEEVKGVTLAL